ncbi:GNAT family N-acetyltransferase [Myxococcota bacterium]|nr:GNAT family N-acetyltransferase [Myxococcota bacterium]
MARIRPVRPDDVPAIDAMIRELAAYERAPEAVVATPADLHAALFTGERSGTGGPALFGHVVEVEGTGGPRLAGFALWFLNYSTWLGRHGLYLEDLYVRAADRGRGYGEALLATLARICVERGFGRFEFWVLDWNTPALDFYRARGAVAMDEWTVQRFTGDALVELARRAPVPR